MSLNIQQPYYYNKSSDSSQQLSYGSAPALNLSKEQQERLTQNPIGKVASGVAEKKDSPKDLAITLTAGGAFTYLVNKFNKFLIINSDSKTSATTFSDSILGKITTNIDDFTNKAIKKFPLLELKGVKKAWQNLSKDNLLKQLVNGKSVSPSIGMAKESMLTLAEKNAKALLEEASELTGKKDLTKDLTKKFLTKKITAEQIYQQALKETNGKTKSKKFQRLSHQCQALINTKNNTLLSKGIKKFHAAWSNIFRPANTGKGLSGKVMGGGFLLMNAYFIGETIKKTIDAPEGEKLSTFAEGIISEFMAGWMLFEPTTKFMYKGIGALKNASGKGIIRKALRGVGNLLSTGLDMKPVPAFVKGSSLGKNILGAAKTSIGKILHTTKAFTGGAGRFAVLMFTLFPIVSSLGEKLSHSIFGKPEHLHKEEELESVTATEKQPVSKNTGFSPVQQDATSPLVKKFLKQRTSPNKPLPARSITHNHQSTSPKKEAYIPEPTAPHFKNTATQNRLNEFLTKTDNVLLNVEDNLNNI